MRIINWSVIALLAGCGGSAGQAGAPGAPGQPGEPGAPGAAGPQGPAGPVEAVIAQVAPDAALGARAARLEIIGIGTSFTDTTTIDFGDPEIKVTKVEARSKANLRVQIDVGGLAKIGAHDVIVTTPAAGNQPEVKLTFKSGLTPMASLVAEATGNDQTIPQGGKGSINVRNLDTANPFTGFTRPAWSFIGFGNLTVNATNISGRGFIDALAPAGGLQVAAFSTASGRTLGYVLDPADVNAPKVVARAATDLALDTAKAGEGILTADATNLYKITAPADEHVLILTLSGIGAGLPARLFGALAPQSGRFRDGHLLYSSGTARTFLGLLPKAGSHYVTVAEDGTTSGANHTYSITAKTAKATKIMVAEPMTPDAPGTPITTYMGAGPAYATDGAIDTMTDVDYIRFKAEKAGPIYVMAGPTGAGATFAAGVSVAIHNDTCAGAALGASQANQQQINATAGTTYCARITGSQIAPYTLVIAQDP
jgi:hypothetical protein